MAGWLVFVLTLLGFALLMIAERVGLSPSLGLMSMTFLLVLAALARGLGSVTSRFARFSGEAHAENHGPDVTALLACCTCVLVALLAFAPVGVDLAAIAPGFAVGFALAHFSRQSLPLPPLAARLARLLVGIAAALLTAVLLRAQMEQLTSVLQQGWLPVRLGLGALAVVILLPGGAWATGRVQRLMLSLALVLTLAPLAALGIGAGLDRGDLLAGDLMAIEMLSALGPMAKEVFGPFHPALSGLIVGAVGGLAARGTSPVSLRSASLGLLGALLITGGVVLLHLAAAEWLARLVGQRIVGLPPASWPVFVFEPELAGWLRACGVPPADPLGVVRACGLSGTQRVPNPSDLSFLATLSLPALAVANKLPVLLGELWALLPALLGGAGLLSLMHGAALAFSETVLFGGLNPTGLYSFRLAMARLSLLALVLALFLVDPLPQLPMATLTSVLAILLGLSALLQGLSWLRRPQPSEGTA